MIDGYVSIWHGRTTNMPELTRFFSLQKQDPKPNSRLIDLRSDRVRSVSTRLMNKHNICPCTYIVLPLAYPTYVLIILVCMFWFVAAVVTQINGVERRP